MDDVDWSSLHKIIGDTTRRNIVELLAEKESLSYTEIMALLEITNTGRLNYHLKALGTLISKDDQGKYHLTERGKLAVNLFQTFPERKTAESKKPLAILEGVLAIGLIVLGVFLICYAVVFIGSTTTEIATTVNVSVSDYTIPQNTTVYLSAVNVQDSNLPLKISWSASSPMSIYIMNRAQYNTLPPEQTANQAGHTVSSFAGSPSSWVYSYDLQTGDVTLNLTQGSYYFLAGSSKESNLYSFTAIQQQTTASSSPAAVFLFALVPLALGIFLLVSMERKIRKAGRGVYIR